MDAVRRQTDSGSRYEAALESALDDADEALARVKAQRHALAVAEAEANKRVQLAEALLSSLPPERSGMYRWRIDSLRPARAGRGTTTTYESIVELFAEHPPREWSAPQIHQSLAGKGVAAEPEQIHNVLQYLWRKGRLRRVSRGRYWSAEHGVGIETGDDLPGMGDTERCDE
jgi:hypothetical protein